MWTPGWLEPESWWLKLPKHYPITSPPTNQKKVYKQQLSPQMLPLKPFPGSYQVVQVFWAWDACSPRLAPCNKHCTSLHHNTGVVHWLCCAWASRPELSLVTQGEFHGSTSVLWNMFFCLFCFACLFYGIIMKCRALLYVSALPSCTFLPSRHQAFIWFPLLEIISL